MSVTAAIDIIHGEVSEVRACRGCLALRCKLYDIRENRLHKVFSELTGLTVSSGLLCSICLHLVRKFKAFQKRCTNAGRILNETCLLSEEAFSSIDRSKLRYPLSRSRTLHINCESTRELSTTDVLNINIELEKVEEKDSEPKSQPLDEEITTVDASKLDNFLDINNAIDDIGLYDVEMENLIDNADDDTNELTDVFANELEFTDIAENSKVIESNVDNADIVDDGDDDYVEPVVKKRRKNEKSKGEKDKSELCKCFMDMWKAVSKVNGDHYQMFERLYRFSLLEERPEFPKVFRRKETKSEVYNFIKFLDLYKAIADDYKVDIEFISILEERRAMEEKRRMLAGDADHCGVCCKKYVKTATRDRHKALAHKESLPWRCAVCGYSLKKEADLMVHLLKFHTTRRRCRECRANIVALAHNSQWSEVQSHIAMYHTQTHVTCEFCGRTFTAAKHCYYHIRQAHLGEMNAARCWLCGGEYNGPQGLRGHVRKIHTHAVKCDTCGVFFADGAAEDTHRAGAEGCRNDGSACPMCGALFPCEAAMKEHYDQTHAKYKCKRCVRTFIKYDSYKMHYYKICSDGRRLPRRASETAAAKREREGKRAAPKKKYVKNSSRRFICDVCGKDFSMRANLLYHLRIHTGEKPYQCDHCHKTFRMANSLQMHSWTHTGERRYKCQLCPKAFRQQGHLRAHMPSHTNEKRYACAVCGKRFTARRTLRLHARAVHEGIAPAPRHRRQGQPGGEGGGVGGRAGLGRGTTGLMGIEADTGQ